MIFSHLEETGYSYLEHLYRAWFFGALMLKGSLSLFIHGLIPSLFETTGSSTIQQLSLLLKEK